MLNKQEQTQQVPIDKSNKFDKIIKENMVECTLPFIDSLFNLNIQPNDMVDIDRYIKLTQTLTFAVYFLFHSVPLP